MKRISILFILLVSISLTNLLQATEDSLITNEDDKTIEVYYFHYSHRCATCIAVEEETINALKDLYPNKWKNEEITFLSIDMDNDDGEEFAKSMKISGQTLIITYKSKKEDLTNEAFLYARSNPDKLKKKIENAINKILE